LALVALVAHQALRLRAVLLLVKALAASIALSALNLVLAVVAVALRA
jgi:hypothetical protein